MKRKVIAMMMGLTLALAVTACGGSDTEADTADTAVEETVDDAEETDDAEVVEDTAADEEATEEATDDQGPLYSIEAAVAPDVAGTTWHFAGAMLDGEELDAETATGVLDQNYGGGSVSGAAFDELYGYDSLTLDEMYAAFSTVWDPSEEEPPLELVGFDTCLMATVDMVYTFSDLAHYLVASEETEPANGWYYSQWGGGLADDPSMDGEEPGRVICDAHYAGCEEVGTQDSTTLSLTDLTKVGPLLAAYDTFGSETLAAACEDPGFFSQFGRAAAKSGNYGGNTREQGYTNMVDLGDMARQSSDMLSSAQEQHLNISMPIYECRLGKWCLL